MKRAWLAFAVVSWLMVGCGMPKITIVDMEPVRLPHTYSVVIATSYPSDKDTETVVQTMKAIMEFEDQLFTPFLAKPLQLKEDPGSLSDLGDSLFLIKRLDFTQLPESRLSLDLEIFEYTSGLKAERSITVNCKCKGMNRQQALKLTAKEAIRHILEQIEPPPDAFLSKGFSGLGDGGADAGECK